MADTLNRLVAVIAQRRAAPPESSYVAALHAKGVAKIAQKLGEEAVETVIAGVGDDPRALVAESADLLFHLLVLLDAHRVPFADVLAELDRRDGVSGIAEKAARAAPAPPPADPTPPPPDPAPEAIALPVRAETEPVLALGGAPAKRPRIRKG